MKNTHTEMTQYLHIMMFMLLMMMLGLSARMVKAEDTSTISPKGFEPIRAKVINETPANFTINVKFMTNTFADTEAPIFAVYTSSTKPDQCADFRNLGLSYNKPSKYERQFDLSENVAVIDAVKKYNCVIIPNIPSDK